MIPNPRVIMLISTPFWIISYANGPNLENTSSALNLSFYLHFFQNFSTSLTNIKFPISNNLTLSVISVFQNRKLQILEDTKKKKGKKRIRTPPDFSLRFRDANIVGLKEARSFGSL